MKKSIPIIRALALLGILSIICASACEGNGGSSAVTHVPYQTKIKKWQKVPTGINFQPLNNEINFLSLSDNKWLYAAPYKGGKIFVINASNITNLFIDAQWKTIFTANTGLTPTGPGKIPDLTTYADTISRLTPTRLGVLVSMFAFGAVPCGGAVALVEGNSFKAAWAPGDPTKLAMWAFGGILNKPDKTQYIYAGQHEGPTTFVTSSEDIAKPSIVGPLAIHYTSSTPFSGSPQLFANTTTKAYIIDTTGARAYNNPTDVGTAAILPDATAAAKPSRWAGEDGTGNYSIHTAIGVGDYLYIGFNSQNGDHGGVFVLNSATDTSPSSIHKDWKNIAVLAFAVDKQQQIWAVTEKALFLVHKDGSKGADFKTTLDEPAAKTGIPTDKISGAQFLGDDLIISTTNDGISIGLSS